MKTRMVKTSFHNDPDIEQLSKDAKWLYMYLITCPYIGLTGVFQVSDKKIIYETGLTSKELLSAKEELSNKVTFLGSWIIIKNSEKNNSFKKSPLTSKAYEKELSVIPEQIQRILSGEDTLLGNIDTPSEKVDRVSEKSDTHSISNNINKRNEGGVGETVVVDHSEILGHFNFRFKKAYQLTPLRRTHLKERLKRFSKEQLKQAVDALAGSSWHRGENERKWSADPDFLFKSDEQVDKWLNTTTETHKPKGISISAMLAKQGVT